MSGMVWDYGWSALTYIPTGVSRVVVDEDGSCGVRTDTFTPQALIPIVGTQLSLSLISS